MSRAGKPSTPARVCVDCRYHEAEVRMGYGGGAYNAHLCRARDRVVRHRVDGHAMWEADLTCEAVRANQHLCGSRGRWYRPNDLPHRGVLRRLADALTTLFGDGGRTGLGRS